MRQLLRLRLNTENKAIFVLINRRKRKFQLEFDPELKKNKFTIFIRLTRAKISENSRFWVSGMERKKEEGEEEGGR